MDLMSLELVLLIILPAASALLVLILERISKKLRKYFVLFSAALELYLVISLFVSNFAAVKSDQFFLQYTFDYLGGPFAINFSMDNLSLFFSLLISAAVFMILIYSFRYIKYNQAKYYSLFFLVLASIQGSVLTADLFTLYLFIEGITVFTTPLISFKKTEETTRAAMQYLFYGIMGGVFFFISIILIYFNIGTLQIAETAQQFSDISFAMQLTIIIFFLLSLIIKLGIFPIHFWLPRAHSACPAPISALLSGVLLKVYLYIFMRIFWTMISFDLLVELHISTFIMDLALISSLLGHIFALQADDFKKMLAYSSIGHIGMILAVMMLDTEAAFYGALLHIAAHMMMKSGLFLSSGYLLRSAGSHQIEELEGIGHKNRITFAAFVIICLGTIGMPPLLGFVSKWYILLAFLEGAHFFAAAVTVAGSLIALFYYLRYISTAYTEVSPELKSKSWKFDISELQHLLKGDNLMSTIVYIFTILIIFFGVSFRYFDMPIDKAIIELLNPQKYIDLVLGG